jgi:tetratricopeptide (TPR) repeat protein
LALFLHSQFRRNYDLIGIPRDNKDHWSLFYVRRGDINMAADTVIPDIAFANNLKSGYDFRFTAAYGKALRAYEKASNFLADDYPLLLVNIGEIFLRQHFDDSSQIYIDRSLKLDPDNWKAHYIQAKLAFNRGDTATAYSIWQTLMTPSLWMSSGNP